MFHVEHFLNKFLPNLDVTSTLESFSFIEKEYLKWNNAISISSIRNSEGFWQKHILDSLCLVSHIANSYPKHEIFDIGSGGGFPGLVLAVCLENKITMVEPIKKKTDFIEHCILRLGLKKAKVITSKYESIKNLPDEVLIVSRALGGYDSMCEYFKRINEKTKIVLMTTTTQKHKFKTKNFCNEYDFVNRLTKNSFKNHVLAEVSE